MMIGPAPMMSTEWMSVRLGIVQTATDETRIAREAKGKSCS
jgi:hypothetical protein